MIVTEESWYIVRNTRGVTGFVGSGTDPIPLTDDEIRKPTFNKPTNGIIESCLYKPLIMEKQPINRKEIAQYIDLREFADEIRFSFANTGYNIISIQKDCILFVGQPMM